jgi:hypothetical protein
MSWFNGRRLVLVMWVLIIHAGGITQHTEYAEEFLHDTFPVKWFDALHREECLRCDSGRRCGASFRLPKTAQVTYSNIPPTGEKTLSSGNGMMGSFMEHALFIYALQVFIAIFRKCSIDFGTLSGVVMLCFGMNRENNVSWSGEYFHPVYDDVLPLRMTPHHMFPRGRYA